MIEYSPFSVAAQPCSWLFCSVRADLRMVRRNIPFCREHALFVWAAIDAEIRASNMTNDDVRADLKAKKAAAAKRAAERDARATEHGTIYYLRIGESIKIGFASWIYDRLKQYPPSTELLAVERGTRQTEVARHREFAELRHAGREWYIQHPKLMDHIQNVASENAAYLREIEEIGWKLRDTPNVATMPKQVLKSRYRGPRARRV